MFIQCLSARSPAEPAAAATSPLPGEDNPCNLLLDLTYNKSPVQQLSQRA